MKKNHLQPIPSAQTHLKIIKRKKRRRKKKNFFAFLWRIASAFFFIWRERASKQARIIFKVGFFFLEKFLNEFLKCCHATMVESFFIYIFLNVLDCTYIKEIWILKNISTIIGLGYFYLNFYSFAFNNIFKLWKSKNMPNLDMSAKSSSQISNQLLLDMFGMSLDTSNSKL